MVEQVSRFRVRVAHTAVAKRLCDAINFVLDLIHCGLGGTTARRIFLVVVTTFAHRDLIIALAARHSLPAVYSFRVLVLAGGLMSYGIDLVDTCRQAAFYVDRILRGDKPGDLPVQAATKFETAVNLKTAKALGLTVPPGLLVAAADVIE